MYTTCLHCQKSLGSNEAIEALPIGRRLAFDGEKGRLWVVCMLCQRWNLTPFDARWEALEQCERAYRDTRVRLSTDNIGLARLRDGTDLVRVGRPLRPEFAAWRYGDQFGRRRRRNALLLAGGVAGAGLAVAGLSAAGVALGTAMPLLQLAAMKAWRQQLLANRVHLDDGRRIAPTGRLRLLQLPVEEGWGVEAGVMIPIDSTKSLARKWDGFSQQYEVGVTTVRGTHAMPLLRRFMPRVNGGGASAAQVRSGVQLIEEAGGPERFAPWAASQRGIWAAKSQFGDTGDVQFIPVAARLALEMSINEEAERRALEGELAQLESAWREAEELAGIADHLVMPAVIERQLDAIRRRLG
ncbi:MAG: hypothetical protein IT355_08245 [Gemmatimonadaceae bacterium]|nr:hypothetical protein [Gemmatimonadaceae bacterium]